MNEINLDLEPNQSPTVFEKEEVAVTVVRDHEPESISPLDLPQEVFRAGLARRGANRQALIDWVREAMVKGIDYGVIETKRGPSKPSLWKPGSEKICGKLEVIPMFPSLAKYEEAAYSGIAIETIVLRCELMYAGHVVAQGVGCRSVAKEYGDINKAFKMAAKSAQIDATLRLAGLSEVFTQDLEDMVLDGEIVDMEVKGTRVVSDPASPHLAPAVQEMLDKAKANREREQAELDKRGPVDRAALKAAGFNVADEVEPSGKCKKCGARVSTHTAKIWTGPDGIKKGGHDFEQCDAARKNPAVYKEGGHHYRKLA